jgi:hypothetical protein
MVSKALWSKVWIRLQWRTFFNCIWTNKNHLFPKSPCLVSFSSPVLQLIKKKFTYGPQVMAIVQMILGSSWSWLYGCWIYNYKMQNPKYQIWTWYFGGRNIVICICCNSQWFNKSSLLGQWYRFILASSSAMSWQEQDATFQWDDDGVFFVLENLYHWPNKEDLLNHWLLQHMHITMFLPPKYHVHIWYLGFWKMFSIEA